MRATRLGSALCLVALIALIAGCRSVSPLAPKTEVDSVLSDLGNYCGEATEILAYGRDHGRLAQLDSKATSSSHQLIRIMRADPTATYYGQTMRRVVSGAADETRECGLGRASSRLSDSL